MNYVEARDARTMDGMRLALTTNVCGPWSEAAKHIFHVKNIPFVPVAQYGGQANEDLVDWTGHGNAPVAVWNDETPRAGWVDILMLAERIAPEPALLPDDPALRAQVFGLSNELCGEWGFGWCRRLMLFPPEEAPENTAGEAMEMLRRRYGHAVRPYDRAPGRVVDILNYLRDVLEAQEAKGSPYLVGDSLTAADIYWAAFSQFLEPMPEDLNPLTGPMRDVYGNVGDVVGAAKHPILFTHRDFICHNYLVLPLDFMDTRETSANT